MPPLSGKSALIVGVNQSRRLEISDKLRDAGAVVVEATTVPQAKAALRQLRFEFVFVDFLGAGVGVLGFLDNIRADDPEARVFVVGAPVDCHLFGGPQSHNLTNLGFDNTPDSMDDVLSAALADADGPEHVGGHGPMAAPSGSTKPDGGQK